MLILALASFEVENILFWPLQAWLQEYAFTLLFQF